jgi:hypothetical protein
VSYCSCEKHDDGSRTWERDCAEHGEEAMLEKMLAPGARIRSRRHPELTGRIKCWEWREPGVISAIPYNIEWDDSARAHDLLGMFSIYGTPESVEAA